LSIQKLNFKTDSNPKISLRDGPFNFQGGVWGFFSKKSKREKLFLVVPEVQKVAADFLTCTCYRKNKNSVKCNIMDGLAVDTDFLSIPILKYPLGTDHLTSRGGYGFFSKKKYSDSQCC
jgi:hypothetical protein